MRLAALIVSHNSEICIPACIASCLRYADQFPGGILVVDNASQDATCSAVAAFPQVRLIANSVNRGFAGAVNQGIRALPHADAVLILNPDVELASSPSALAEALENNPRVGAAGGLLLDPRGEPQRGFLLRRLPTPASLCFEILGLNRLFPSNPVNRAYRALDVPLDRPASGLQPPGACLLVRRAAWEHLSGFDESFHPVWFEDVDFIRRLLDSGWDTRYTPAFRAVHIGGHSVLQSGWEQRQRNWYSGLIRYVSRHFQTTGRILVCLSVIVGTVPRIVTGIFWQRSLGPLRLYAKLVRLACAAAVAPGQRPAALQPEEELRDPAHAPGRPGL
ncbi:MAG: glycosyltransferase family 2 protein [Bryobacteraceae bacterium]